MKLLIYLQIFLLFIFIQACTPKNPESKQKNEDEQIIQGEAQGTTYTVKYIAEHDSTLKRQVEALLKEIDLSLSTYIPNSTISQLNQGDSIQVDRFFEEIFIRSKELSKLTKGAFDPTIAPLIEAWGFDYSKPEQMDTAVVEAHLSHCGFHLFELKNFWLIKKDPKAKLNFNAIAQGYTVDLMAELLEYNGINRYFIELGGEVIVKGKNKNSVFWRVGIDRPSGTNLERQLSAVLSLENKAVVTSGNYRKFVEINGVRYNHTINPKTGFPVRHALLSATVVAENSATADALATAFMVMGVEKSKSFLKDHPEYDAILIFSGREEPLETYITAGIREKVEEI